jgi:hypothetical protein
MVDEEKRKKRKEKGKEEDIGIDSDRSIILSKKKMENGSKKECEMMRVIA